ncbi:MAG: 2-amino-4-hydroxy-6-hydroxymethyldihydropteridine diphosphokinase [SAR324 cluster bacterium]|nr:2-amino-4-hydroxy-6-hydroxymethyldihydropteridine diphosphokinase [SAR324 cluster bacterium]
MPHEVVIGLGSNIDPEANLEQAVQELKSRFKVSKQSQWTLNKPICIQYQPDFYNGALLMETELEQQSLKKELKRIEDILGRDRSLPKFGPRTIDLDILIWNKKVVDEDYYERDFLRKGVEEIIPDLELV